MLTALYIFLSHFTAVLHSLIRLTFARFPQWTGKLLAAETFGILVLDGYSAASWFF